MATAKKKLELTSDNPLSGLGDDELAEIIQAAQEHIEKKRKREVDVVKVTRHEEALNVPASMTLVKARDVIDRQIKYEEEEVQVIEAINAFPWDGALAFQKAMQVEYGWATAEPTPGFFGPQPPKLIAVEVGFGKTINVVWGRFSVPGIEGYLQTSSTEMDGRVIFQIAGVVKRKNEEQVKKLAEMTRLIVSRHSIYRGQAFKMRFKDDNGEKLGLPTPRFLDLSGVRQEDLIFPDSVMEKVVASVFAPVIYRDAARLCGVPGKRGILLEGGYGTGKTLVTNIMAKLCVENNTTFIYLPRVEDLQDAVRFGLQYPPCVIVGEDIDRIVQGDRSVKMDDILNIIDGIESKHSQIMVLLTTNFVEKINQAMLRPGRLDDVITVFPPDAKAAEKLVRVYGRNTIAENVDLHEVGVALAGKIPAVIREVVERSKLYVIARTKGQGPFDVIASDLVAAADSMNRQLELLAGKPEDNRTDMEKLGDILGRRIAGGVKTAIERGVNLSGLAPLGNGDDPDFEFDADLEKFIHENR